MMMWWRLRLIGLAVVGTVSLALAVPASAQESGVPRSVVATAVTHDVRALSDLRAAMARLENAGSLRLASRFADRRKRGRVHEYFAQFHRGVPVYGGGLALQRDGEATVSIFGTLHRGIDVVDALPRISATEAVTRATNLAGVGPATTDEPPMLTVLPVPLGGYVLAWRLVMRDFGAWFIDARTGELAKRRNLVSKQQGIAVGGGLGAFGQRQKVSVTKVSRSLTLTGEGFEARDQLRGAEIVTLDMGGDHEKLWRLLAPEEFWGPADIAFDPDNEWDTEAVVDVHAHMGFAYDYLRQQQDWRGLDGDDGRMVVATNLVGLENAFWAPPPFGFEGTGGLAFGGLGFGGAENRADHFGVLDIVGHEAMHGVTHFSVHRRTGSGFGDAHTYVLGPKKISIAGRKFRCGDVWEFPEGPGGPLLCENGRFLLFLDEARAINEAMSDIFGTALEFAIHPPGPGPLHADYVIGEDLFPLRVIDDPSAQELAEGIGITFPDAMAGIFRFPVALVGANRIRYAGIVFRDGRPVGFSPQGDYSGEHWNSTILSHSFFLAVEGGLHRSSGTTVTGVGAANRDRVVRIYFRALTELMPAQGTFEMMAAAVRQSAVDLYGVASAEYTAVHRALAAVGLPAR